jgi:hypothetical protein
MGIMGDLVFFMTSELTTESRSVTSNGVARPPRPSLLLRSNKIDENIILPPPSSRHHWVVPARQGGAALLASGGCNGGRLSRP